MTGASELRISGGRTQSMGGDRIGLSCATSSIGPYSTRGSGVCNRKSSPPLPLLGALFWASSATRARRALARALADHDILVRAEAALTDPARIVRVHAASSLLKLGVVKLEGEPAEGTTRAR